MKRRIQRRGTVIVCALLGSMMSGEHARGPFQSGAQQFTPQVFVTCSDKKALVDKNLLKVPHAQ